MSDPVEGLMADPLRHRLDTATGEVCVCGQRNRLRPDPRSAEVFLCPECRERSVPPTAEEELGGSG
jgi:uncharacterized protein YlaI